MRKEIIEVQKEKSHYGSKSIHKKTIHHLLHTEGLNLEPSLRKVFEYLWNCDFGVTKASVESISKTMTRKMGKGYGLSTIEKGIRLAKKYNLLTIEINNSQKTGYRNCAWKIINAPEVIYAFIQEKVPHFSLENKVENEVENKVENEVENEVRENGETPCESKDKEPEKELNKTKLNLIKDNKTLYNNRLDEKKNFIIHNPLILEIVNSFTWSVFKPERVAKEIVLALKEAETELTEENKFVVYGAIGKLWRDFEKNGKQLKKQSSKYRYAKQSIHEALTGYYKTQEVIVEEGKKTIVEHHHIHEFKKRENVLTRMIKDEYGLESNDDFMNWFYGEEEGERERKDITNDVLFDNVITMIESKEQEVEEIKENEPEAKALVYSTDNIIDVKEEQRKIRELLNISIPTNEELNAMGVF